MNWTVNWVALPRMLRAARFRFAALYVGVFAVSALVLGVAVFLAARSALQQQTDGRIEAEIGFLREEFRAGGLDHGLAVVRARGHGVRALDYLVQDANAVHLAGEMPAAAGLRPGWTVVDVPQAAEDGGRPERVRALVTALDGGVLLAVGEDEAQMAEVEEAIATAFLWTVGLAAVLAIGGGSVLSRAFLRRVEAISSTAEAIIEGDLARRIPLRGTGDDLDRLAGTLNRMLDRIGGLIDSLRQVSSDVAHDLRTPLSRLYQRLEDVRSHASSVAEYESAIDAAVTEAEGLLEIFSALLRIAQVEGALPRASFQAVSLSEVASAVVDAYRPDAENADHALSVAIEPGLFVHGDRELLMQMVANLLENELRHTPAGTRVAVRLCARGPGATLVVEDDGPGAAASDLPHLARRFFRGERSRTTPGNGLGLSLVSAVAELHGAAFAITGLQPGLRVSLAFPPPHPE